MTPTCTKVATKAWLAKDGNQKDQNAKRQARRERTAPPQLPDLTGPVFTMEYVP